MTADVGTAATGPDAAPESATSRALAAIDERLGLSAIQ
jgi:hypothetical protein